VKIPNQQFQGFKVPASGKLKAKIALEGKAISLFLVVNQIKPLLLNLTMICGALLLLHLKSNFLN